MVYKLLYLTFGLMISKIVSQTLTVSCIRSGESVTLSCETTDFTNAVLFYLTGVNKGGCTGGTCLTGIAGYNTPTQSGTSTEMVIIAYDHSRDGGDWTCNYGSSTSDTKAAAIGNYCTTPSEEGLSTGAIVGIVVTVVCVLVIVIIILIWRFRPGHDSKTQLPDESSKQEAIIGTDVELLHKLCELKLIQSVKWLYNNKMVVTGEDCEYKGGNTNRPSLTISCVSKKDFGSWKCILETKNSKQNFVVQLIPKD